MITFILGATGHGKMQYGLTKTVEKSHGKKILIISNEISPEIIIRRLDSIYEFNNTISPSEILIKSEFNYSDLSFVSAYDVISILGYIHNNVEGRTPEADLAVFQSTLKKLKADFPEKEIIASIQLNRSLLQTTFKEVKKIFFESELESDEGVNHIMIYRDSEDEKFKILNHYTKEVESIDKRDLFCEKD